MSDYDDIPLKIRDATDILVEYGLVDEDLYQTIIRAAIESVDIRDFTDEERLIIAREIAAYELNSMDDDTLIEMMVYGSDPHITYSDDELRKVADEFGININKLLED